MKKFLQILLSNTSELTKVNSHDYKNKEVRLKTLVYIKLDFNKV